MNNSRRSTFMNDTEEFIDSERGTKAAWKGFSSQTLYIASRLMLLGDDSEFFPEKVEDLLIRREDIPVEAVQVKNLASNLALSHFNPQKSDSFFRRSLSLRQENEQLRIIIVSFGTPGKELLDLQNGDEDAKQNILRKLLEYGYDRDDADWILAHLEIQEVDKDQLETQIYSELNRLTETFAAPNLVFSVLTNYISMLSQNGEKTSKAEWSQKLHNIATDFAAMSGFQQEYGRSLRPLFEYTSGLTLEKLTEQFRIGVNAHPDHIRHNLDLKREKWIAHIEKSFESNQIVILRGASGQGKSSLAYRYLIDTFPESNVFCIEQIETNTQAANIVAAISNLSVARENKLIAYIDVSPYQTGWLWVIKQLQKTGRKIKLLVTIREEDYRRTVVDKSSIQFDEIEVIFEKSEAEWIYRQYASQKFRNFEEAWQKFGETGPLMEFIYLINEVETLQQKLEAQINTIIMEEPEAESWLGVLRLSSYAGRYNINLNLRKTILATRCKNYEKMIYLFEKEYLLRETENKAYIEPLHAIRAQIIYSILENLALYPEEELLLMAIRCVDNHSQMLIVNHCYGKQCTLDLVEKIASIKFDKWASYASVIKGILWIEVYELFLLNRDLILEGDSYFNNSFGIISLADKTGLLGEVNLDVLFEIMEKTNPQGVQKFKNLAAKLHKKISYSFLDTFFKLSINNLHRYLPENNIEISDLGYVLFWFSIRRVFIDPFFDGKKLVQLLEIIEIENLLDLMEGMYYQKWSELYNLVLPLLKAKVSSKWRIVHLEVYEDTINTHFIAELFEATDKSGSTSAHIQTMSVIKALRKLYPGKKKYATKIIGADFLEQIPIIDGKKNIEAKHLPNEWITQLNSWYNNLNVYEHRPATWNEYVESILITRPSIANSAQAISKGINYLYKKNGDLNRLIDESITRLLSDTAHKISKDTSLLPKCSMDRFGFGDDSENNGNKNSENIQAILTLNNNSKNSNEVKNIQELLTLRFRDAFRKYCSSFLTFLNQKDALLISRVKRISKEQNSHLPLINLIEAASNLKAMQREFEKLFTDLISPDKLSLLCTQETTNIELLLEVWYFLEKNDLQKIDSVEWDRKRLIKQKKRKLVSFFNQRLRELGNSAFVSNPVTQSDGSINIYILVEITSIDALLATLFREFKYDFPDATTLTIDALFIQNYVNNLIVIPTVKDQPIPGAIRVEIRNLINFDFEKFTRYLLPYEFDEYITNKFPFIATNKNIIFRWSLLLGLANYFRLLLSHAEKTNQALNSLPQTTINSLVVNKWRNDGVNSLSESITQFSDEFQLLSEIIREKEGAMGYLDTISKVINVLQSSKNKLMESPGKSFYLILDELTSNIGYLYSYIA